MVRLRARAHRSDADFLCKQIHGLDLLFHMSKSGQHLLLVPCKCRQLLLDEAHGSNVSGHFGYAKTLRLLRARVWWPHMAKHVQKHVKACQVC